MIQKNDWRLLNNVEDLNNKYVNSGQSTSIMVYTKGLDLLHL